MKSKNQKGKQSEKTSQSLTKFMDFVKDQFTYGGQKYALNNERESTDVLFDTYGRDWLIGTMHKYVFRFRNMERERDILKIATYAYILWLKRGFHLVHNDGVDSPVINTTVEVKEKFFSEFCDKIRKVLSDTDDKDWICDGFNDQEEQEQLLLSVEHLLSDGLSLAGATSWKNVWECHIFHLFVLCFFIWVGKFSESQIHDTDTWNK